MVLDAAHPPQDREVASISTQRRRDAKAMFFLRFLANPEPEPRTQNLGPGPPALVRHSCKEQYQLQHENRDDGQFKQLAARHRDLLDREAVDIVQRLEFLSD